MTPPSPYPNQIAERLSDAAKADLLSERWYLASCDHCGWFGSSKECGTDHGPWGDSDVYCPKCNRPGADCGKLGEQFGDEVENLLREAASKTRDKGVGEPDGFCRMHFEDCDYFTSRGSLPCSKGCCDD